MDLLIILEILLYAANLGSAVINLKTGNSGIALLNAFAAGFTAYVIIDLYKKKEET